MTSLMITTHDGTYENVAADQARALFDLHRHQLRGRSREVAELRAELSRVGHARAAELAAADRRHGKATEVLRRTERELRADLAQRDAEVTALRETLAARDGALEETRVALAAARERTLGAEQRAFDAEVQFKDREKKLLRQCKQQAVDFHRRLTSAFEQRLQKIKIQHAQDVFVARKSGVSS